VPASKPLAWILGLVAFLAAVIALQAGRTPRDHPLGTTCANCHLAGNATTADNAHVLTERQERLCGRCHPSAIQLSHPTGIRPTNPLPIAYPADWKGELTCTSCHGAHARGPEKLRGAARGKAFCLACHDESFFRRMRDGGLSTLRAGHLSSGRTELPPNLDGYSLQCLECHGRHGDPDAARIDANRILRHAGDRMNHPIGRDYARAVRFGGYRPMNLLSRQVLLPGGMISCVSCHKGYSREHGALVRDNRGSALCMECHDL
jgi:predicted CXXCH cytochrome family protein